jgi:hypothetical protein
MMVESGLARWEVGMTRLTAFLLAGLVAASGSFACGQAADDKKDTPLRVSTQLVLVPALVREKSGALVYTLAAKDFVLTDDGVAQKVTLEQDIGGEPLALVVVMEAGAARQSTGWKPTDRKDPANRFAHLSTLVEGIVGDVEKKIAVVEFDSRVQAVEDFTSDMDSVESALADASADENSDGGAAILDGLGFAVEMLRKQPSKYRRAILLLSETNDRGSKLPLAHAVRAVTDTNTTIYSAAFSSGKAASSEYAHKWLPTKKSEPRVDPAKPLPPPGALPGSSYDVALKMMVDYMTMGVFGTNAEPYPPGGCFAKDPDAKQPKNTASRIYDCLGQLAPPLALAKMAALAAADGIRMNVPKTVAEMTGGEYYSFNSEKSLETALTTIANHVPNRYVLSFQPHEPHPGIHALELKLPEYPELAVTARSSYWADTVTMPQH